MNTFPFQDQPRGARERAVRFMSVRVERPVERREPVPIWVSVLVIAATTFALGFLSASMIGFRW